MKISLIILAVLAYSIQGIIAAPIQGQSHDDGDDSRAAFDIIAGANSEVMTEEGVREGDMRITQEAFDAMTSGDDDTVSDDASRASRKRRGASATSWKWKGGVVPYVIDSGMGAYGQRVIQQAIADFHAKTCIRLIPRTTEPDYVEFKPSAGCWSYLGRIGGAQTISLGPGCHAKRVVLHEVLHALGFFHEQSRPDRDDYVTIMWDNIRPGMERNFKKYSNSHIDSLGFDYDKQGIMHYSGTAFSKNGLATIVSKGNDKEILGRAWSLTDNDIAQLRAYYGCQPSSTSVPSTTTRATKKPTTVAPSTTEPTTTTKPKTTSITEATTTTSSQTPTKKATTTAKSSTTIVTSTATITTTAACVDHDIEFCSQTAIQTYSKRFCSAYKHIREKCPRTCGECGSQDCSGLFDSPELEPYCGSYSKLCGLSTWMVTNCLKTCCLKS